MFGKGPESEAISFTQDTLNMLQKAVVSPRNIKAQLHVDFILYVYFIQVNMCGSGCYCHLEQVSNQSKSIYFVLLSVSSSKQLQCNCLTSYPILDHIPKKRTACDTLNLGVCDYNKIQEFIFVNCTKLNISIQVTIYACLLVTVFSTNVSRDLRRIKLNIFEVSLRRKQQFFSNKDIIQVQGLHTTPNPPP